MIEMVNNMFQMHVKGGIWNYKHKNEEKTQK